MQTYTVTFRNSDDEVKQYDAPLNRDDLKTEAELLSRCGCTRVTIKDDAGRMVFFGDYPDAKQPMRGWSKFMASVFGFAAVAMSGCTSTTPWEPTVSGMRSPYEVHQQQRGAAYQPQYQPAPAPKYRPGRRQTQQQRFYADPVVSGEQGQPVDPTSQLYSDKYECRKLAQQASGMQGQVVASTGMGAAFGGALGAVTCAVAGCDPAAGAAGGAGIVGLLSGGASALGQDQRYRQAFARCLSQRGWQVVDGQQ